MSLIRLDVLVTRRGLCASRTEAKQAIEAGLVLVEGSPASKPSGLVEESAAVALSVEARRFVSRGGDKLDYALDRFAVDVAGKLCLDVGASTGGFTDCLLQRGAKHVTAIDVGHGQMHSKLRTDSRADCREGVNARTLSPADFPYLFDIAVADLSFISLRLILPALRSVLRDGADAVCLVKPQFEVGKKFLGKGGIVRSESARLKAVEEVRTNAAQLGFNDLGIVQSPLEGGDGNIEYLLHLRLQPEKGEPRCEPTNS